MAGVLCVFHNHSATAHVGGGGRTGPRRARPGHGRSHSRGVGGGRRGRPPPELRFAWRWLCRLSCLVTGGKGRPLLTPSSARWAARGEGGDGGMDGEPRALLRKGGNVTGPGSAAPIPAPGTGRPASHRRPRLPAAGARSPTPIRRPDAHAEGSRLGRGCSHHPSPPRRPVRPRDTRTV